MHPKYTKEPEAEPKTEHTHTMTAVHLESKYTKAPSVRRRRRRSCLLCTLSDYIRSALNMALTLVKVHNLERLQEVVGIVTRKLEAAELFDKAAAILEDVGSYKEAAEMYIKGSQWEKASSLALTPGDDVLQKYIDGLYKEHLLKNGEANILVKIGSIPEALEVYVQQENWEKVHELAASLGPELEKEFSLRHAACYLQQAKIVEAISIMARYELPLTGATYELCNYASQQLFSSSEENSTFQRTMKELRMLLYHFWESMRDINGAISFQVILELERLVTAVTLVTVRSAFESQGLLELAAKVSISLLRHIGLIPADKAFYDAGIACKQVQWYNIGFIFMNAYLDVAEAIDDKDTGLTTEHLFEQSDIPAEFPIPECHSITEEKREEARDWLIQLSMDEKVEERLPMRKCDSCGALIFEASLVCFSCKDKSEACSVTGYPLLQTECVECHHCHKLANKDDWNAYIGAFHSCPWCNKPNY